MNKQDFIKAYMEVRNGANYMVRHPLVPFFIFSDGVKECADAGCFWLIDILATELPGAFRKQGEAYTCYVTVKVADGKATIEGCFDANDDVVYTRLIDYTDMPEGEWRFYVAQEGDEGGRSSLVCILPTEY